MRAADAVGIGADALSAAEQAGLVSVRGARVELRHPLVRSAIYQGSSSSERRAAHLALADALGGELEADQRAWHRAAAALAPTPTSPTSSSARPSGPGCAAGTPRPPRRWIARPS